MYSCLLFYHNLLTISATIKHDDFLFPFHPSIHTRIKDTFSSSNFPVDFQFFNKINQTRRTLNSVDSKDSLTINIIYSLQDFVLKPLQIFLRVFFPNVQLLILLYLII